MRASSANMQRDVGLAVNRDSANAEFLQAQITRKAIPPRFRNQNFVDMH